MPTAEFDTLTAAQELRDSGISEAQAAAIVQAVRSAVATHAASRTDVAEFRAEALAKIDAVEANAKADIAEVLARIDAARAEAKADNAALRADLYRALWIQGMGIVGVTVALIKLLP